MDNGIQPVLPIGTNYGNGGFGGGFGSDALWIFAILALFGGRGGFFGGNGGYQPQYATQQDVQYTSQFGQLLDGNRDILGAISNGTAQAVATTNQTFHDTVSVLSDKYNEIQRDLATLAVGQSNALANQNACCCETKMQLADVASTINANIAQSRYDAAMNTEKILSAMAQDKIEALQNRINSLELAQATANTVKYPNSFVYASPANPFCNTGCGCGCNNF